MSTTAPLQPTSCAHSLVAVRCSVGMHSSGSISILGSLASESESSHSLFSVSTEAGSTAPLIRSETRCSSCSAAAVSDVPLHANSLPTTRTTGSQKDYAAAFATLQGSYGIVMSAAALPGHATGSRPLNQVLPPSGKNSKSEMRDPDSGALADPVDKASAGAAKTVSRLKKMFRVQQQKRASAPLPSPLGAVSARMERRSLSCHWQWSDNTGVDCCYELEDGEDLHTVQR
ncbi:hypothetical protein C8F01DRAFT_1236972 [Mycena amicta]|nr:hypothetical protein C8F01DRAFT_1236972 [Mycena amicta]